MTGDFNMLGAWGLAIGIYERGTQMLLFSSDSPPPSGLVSPFPKSTKTYLEMFDELGLVFVALSTHLTFELLVSRSPTVHLQRVVLRDLS